MNVRYSKESYPSIDFYNFKYNGVSISISLTKNPSGNQLELSQFFNSGNKGDGKRLLCHVLKWIKINMSEYTELTLASVPDTTTYRKRGITQSVAENKLNSYYESLGFIRNSNGKSRRYFTGNIDTLIENTCKEEGGKRKNRTRKRK
jgi:hypothetical protein